MTKAQTATISISGTSTVPSSLRQSPSYTEALPNKKILITGTPFFNIASTLLIAIFAIASTIIIAEPIVENPTKNILTDLALYSNSTSTPFSVSKLVNLLNDPSQKAIYDLLAGAQGNISFAAPTDAAINSIWIYQCAFVDFILTCKVVIPTQRASATALAAKPNQLVSAVNKINPVTKVDTTPNITFLEPSDEAFNSFAAIASTLSNTQFENMKVRNARDIPTWYGNHTLFETNDGVKKIWFSGTASTSPAKVLTSDILILNGVAHVIDAVLMPSAYALGLFTSTHVPISFGAATITGNSGPFKTAAMLTWPTSSVGIKQLDVNTGSVARAVS
ncbi:hypothetical protein HDU76_004267, partial [Blyttiomyces sp. JEL0837]